MANIVITGAGQGLGQNLSRKFDVKGNKIFLLGRDEKKLKKTEEYIEAAEVFSIPVDLCDEVEVKQVFQKIQESVGKINLLINNAATWTGGKSILEISYGEMVESINLNFLTAFNCIKGTLEGHQEFEDISIFNIGATASHRGGKNVSAFAVAKSALQILSESLAREMSSKGVHVCHFTIDGLILNERTIKLNPDVKDDSFIKMDSISNTIEYIYNQPKDCWTFEIDLRPFNERF